MSEVIESPVFLLLDPSIDHTRKDLPVTLHETGGAGVQGRAGGAQRAFLPCPLSQPLLLQSHQAHQAQAGRQPPPLHLRAYLCTRVFEV